MAQDPNARDEVVPRRRVPDRTLISIMMLLLLVVVGVFAYRMSARPAEPDVAAADPSPVDRAGERLPGGVDPEPKFKSTRDELEYRGAGERPQGPMPGLGNLEPVTRLSDITKDGRAVSGRRVELKDVEVESASGTSFWIKDGPDKVAVTAPAGTPALRAGQRVSLSGRVEASGGEARITATRVELHD